MSESTLTALFVPVILATAACSSEAPTSVEGVGAAEQDQYGRPTNGADKKASTGGEPQAADPCAGVTCSAEERCYPVPTDNGGGLLAARVAAGQKIYACAEPCSPPLVNIITAGYYGPPSSSCGEPLPPQASSHKQGN